MIFKIKNNTPIPYSIEKFKEDNPNIAFGKSIPHKFMVEQNLIKIFPEQKPEITTSQKLVLNTIPVKNSNGDWVLTWTILDLSEDEQRAWRNNELKNTDWILSVADHPGKNMYIKYRQALRDWPETNEFPSSRPTLEDFSDE